MTGGGSGHERLCLIWVSWRFLHLVRDWFLYPSSMLSFPLSLAFSFFRFVVSFRLDLRECVSIVYDPLPILLFSNLCLPVSILSSFFARNIRILTTHPIFPFFSYLATYLLVFCPHFFLVAALAIYCERQRMSRQKYSLIEFHHNNQCRYRYVSKCSLRSWHTFESRCHGATMTSIIRRTSNV